MRFIEDTFFKLLDKTAILRRYDKQLKFNSFNLKFQINRVFIMKN